MSLIRVAELGGTKDVRTVLPEASHSSTHGKHGKKEIGMAHPIVHFEIRSADPDATRRFYGGLSGWTYAPAGMPGYTYVDTGAEATLRAGIGPLQGGSSMLTIYVGVEDVAAALEAAERLGGTIVQRPAAVPGVTFALLADPQGHVIGVSQTT
jgi:predicted enzyme related to lactoylglutathione lyase